MTSTLATVQTIIDTIGVPVILIQNDIVIQYNQATKRYFASLVPHLAQNPSLKHLFTDTTYADLQRALHNLPPDDSNPQQLTALSFNSNTCGDDVIDNKVDGVLHAAPYAGVHVVALTLIPASQTPSNNHAPNYLHPPNQEFAALYAISEAVGSDRDLDDILAQFLQHLRDLVPFDSASIILMLPDEPVTFVLQGIRHVTHDIHTIIEGSNLKSSPLIQHIMTSRAPFIVPDVFDEPMWVHIPGLEHIRCWMGIPLVYQNKAIGILMLDKHEVDFYTPRHADYALTVARQAAVAIQNVYLYRQAQLQIKTRRQAQSALVESLARLDIMHYLHKRFITAHQMADVLPDTLVILGRVLQSNHMLLFDFDDVNNQPRHMVYVRNNAHQTGDEALQQAWRIFWQVIGEPDNHPPLPPNYNLNWPNGIQCTVTQDGEPHQAFAVVLNQHGLLIAARPATMAHYQAEDRDLLLTITDQLAILIENETLNSRLRDYTTQLEQILLQRTAQLQLERERLQAIIQSTEEGIIYMEDYIFQYVNPQICQMLGYEPLELLGKRMSDIRIESSDFRLNDVTKLVLGRHTGNTPNASILKRSDGSQFYATMTFSFIGKPGENPVRMVAVIRDMTDDHAMQEYRARFMDNAAHELRTPLTRLGLRLKMIEKQRERLDIHLEHLQNTYFQMKHLVEQLLDLTRFENGKAQIDSRSIVAQVIIQQTIDTLQRHLDEKPLTLNTQFPDTPIHLRVDADWFLQAIHLLLLNAIAYNDDTSTIHIVVSVVRQFETDYLLVECINDGDNIPEDLLPHRIFEPFSRPTSGNMHITGMELALVQYIVYLHNGMVNAMNRPHKGSTYTLHIPLKPPDDDDDLLLDISIDDETG